MKITRRNGLQGLTAAGLAALAGKAEAQGLRIGDKVMDLRVTPVSATTVRLELRPQGHAAVEVDTGALADRVWPTAVTVRGPKRLRCGDLFVAVTQTPLEITLTRRDGSIVQRLSFDGKGFRFALDKAPVLGMGQGGPGFDRRGTVQTMVSGQGGYQLSTHGARVPVPWLVGTSGWGLFVHSPIGAFDLSDAGGRFQSGGDNPAFDLFVVGAREPAAIMAAYAELTGLPEMPPLWAFGYQQSHRTLGPPEEILAEAKRFRDEKMPCDALIYLGTGFCPNGWNTDNGEFSWNAKPFPDPKAAIDGLHADGFKVVLHVVVEAETMTGRVTDPCTAAPLPSGRTPDGKWPPNRQVSCYWPFHKPLSDLGVDGWWPDQGDDLDAPSRLARNRMYYEGQQLWRPNERVYALHRNGFAGMQRFGAFLWSGDVETRWDTLTNHVPIAINTSLSGLSYWGTDIGGFVTTADYSGELYARWFQFAAFTPLFRSHGRDWRMHTPWGWTDGNRGYAETNWKPAPETLHDPRVQPICRQYLELRYRLMPYLYSAVAEGHRSGLPIVRALWLHYPDDTVAVARGDQYLFGRDILVAPVTEKGATARKVYLPKGLWYDFWTHETVHGGREITRPVDLATLPLYVRAGAILPLGPVKQTVHEASDAPLTLRLYPGADGTFALYEDDGKTFDFRNGTYHLTQFAWSEAQRQLTIKSLHGDALPRKFVVEVAGLDGSQTIDFDGRSAMLHI
jgi:alpha-glucosidase/alpha-D-xyloside xylohydrolase